MKFEILTIFPELFESFRSSSLIGKAASSGTINIRCTNIRDFAAPPHFHVDDTPYGGGAGMVMRPEPLAGAIQDAKTRLPDASVVYLSPTGQPFTQAAAELFSGKPSLILLCGRYEGIDQRVVDLYVDYEVSLGDFVLMGGEVAAMAVVEATARLVDGVVGNPRSLEEESFRTTAPEPILEAPHYTKPREFEGQEVPEVLLTGDHAAIARWREQQALARTKERRPDLLK